MYPIDLGDAKRGHEQRGKRLGIVMSDGPAHWSTVTVVPTSTRALPANFRPLLMIDGRETLALVDHVRSIDVKYVLGDPVDHLTREDMAQVEFALGRWLDLRIELDY
ncbi:type II toxin-antitoxin system PemK/MazF family toxin [Streptomyces dubilierae]|uniref:Type II toxin-antitoxin system PemK/MazF family toxin n=1 Tax=Streptomyces dubilierae TaxID=3075533 RepID=A0ABU2P920_9ACTN|nr:type II toxin-antitoxin system PemK/MazF family toxin [Streptomyces sp. DSM 41921]MDT0388278.1 type II toxin-antitoxin system PemK/MazF family toxin [Streptomyces sp. DSM 41921]